MHDVVFVRPPACLPACPPALVGLFTQLLYTTFNYRSQITDWHASTPVLIVWQMSLTDSDQSIHSVLASIYNLSVTWEAQALEVGKQLGQLLRSRMSTGLLPRESVYMYCRFENLCSDRHCLLRIDTNGDLNSTVYLTLCSNFYLPPCLRVRLRSRS